MNCILLVEHPAAPVAGIDACIGALGQVLVRAASAAEALEHARSTDFVLVLAALPGDGADVPELLRQLRANRRSRQSPLIVLAPAGGADFPLERCYLAGAVDVLVGAVAPAVLQAKVRFYADAMGSARERAAQAELRDSEERYRTLFESIDEGVCIIEVLFDDAGTPYDYRFLEMNQAFVEHTGLADAVGKTVLEMVPGHDQHWFKIYGKVARTGEAIRFENEAHAMGRWYDVYATRVGSSDSRKVALLFADISARKRAEAELRRLAADLTDADRRKTEFLATLAHELRNPLAPLRSGLQVLRLSAADPAATARVLEVMERQLGHMVELVDDLLDVARITRGQVGLKQARIDLKDVLDAAIETAMPVIEEHCHRLQLQVAAEPMPLCGDATRLTQVVNNLLNNAAKYTPRGGAITLAARRERSELVISVADDGVGIAPESLEEVFGLFNQVGRERGRSQGGLGIGLSLVRSMVELHGGSVTAASAGLRQGSIFTVRLPCSADAAAGTGGAIAPAPAAPVHRVRVLVVDDNRDAADTLSALLDLLGHRAQVANDGRAALEAMQDFRPQVVFLDLGMPGMSGYQVAQAIRNDRRFDQPLLVALTGWGGEDDRQRTGAAGFDLHLTKPADLGAIEQILGRL
jgi:PAS domain S-box-containing protein